MKKIPQYHNTVYIEVSHVQIAHPLLINEFSLLNKVEIFPAGKVHYQIQPNSKVPILQFFLPGDTKPDLAVISKRAWHDGKLQWDEAQLNVKT